MRLQQIERQFQEPTECASECEMPKWLCNSREHCKEKKTQYQGDFGTDSLIGKQVDMGNEVIARERENQARDDSGVLHFSSDRPRSHAVHERI